MHNYTVDVKAERWRQQRWGSYSSLRADCTYKGLRGYYDNGGELDNW